MRLVAASVTNWTRRLVKNTSPATYKASARSRTSVTKAPSISLLLLALRTRICSPIARAASDMARSALSVAGALAGLDQHGDPNGLGHQLMQKCQPLLFQLSREKINSRQVAARPGQAGDKTKLHRVFADAKDDRDCRGRPFCHQRCKIAGGRGDNGHTTAHEIIHKRRKATELALQPVVLHRYVLAIEVAGLAKAVSERGAKGRVG